MRLLAIESSAKAASVAVTEDGALVGQYFQSSGLTHSRTLLKMAEDLLENLELRLSDIDAVAVARGRRQRGSAGAGTSRWSACPHLRLWHGRARARGTT